MKEAFVILVGMLTLALAGTAGGGDATLPEGFAGQPREITRF